MPSFEEFLQASPAGEGAWRFHIGHELHGAFGGAFGGFLAAACVFTARSVAPGRVPNALDCRFVRGLREPGATVTATVLHSGRSLTNVSLDLVDDDDKLCTRATVSLVDRDVLATFERSGPPPGDWKSHEEASRWPALAPIVTAIDSRIVGEDDRHGVATAVHIPWDGSDTPAEAACIPADMAVGPPVGGVTAGEKILSPNPDLSMRFCGEVTTPTVIGTGRLERASGGVAAVRVGVWSAGRLVALGMTTHLLLPQS
ncbi:MAG: acyl-CoA thioesterase domain-containing protein [Actinomycetota bacterium]